MAGTAGSGVFWPATIRGPFVTGPVWPLRRFTGARPWPWTVTLPSEKSRMENASCSLSSHWGDNPALTPTQDEKVTSCDCAPGYLLVGQISPNRGGFGPRWFTVSGRGTSVVTDTIRQAEIVIVDLNPRESDGFQMWKREPASSPGHWGDNSTLTRHWARPSLATWRGTAVTLTRPARD